MHHNDYYLVTELPGQNATQDQLSIMLTRYHLAAQYSNNRKVLEIACGSGTGLGYLAQNATKVVGGDIDPKLIAIPVETYKDDSKVDALVVDAHAMPFEDNSFDLILIYEAIYYLQDITKFMSEVKRVLTPKGQFIISSVNREWHGFNASPHSVKYYSMSELHTLLEKDGYTTTSKVGFEDRPSGLKSAVVSVIRKVAVGLGLIPNTMEGKERLKRMFYGELTPIPSVVTDDTAPLEPLLDYNDEVAIEDYKFLYTISSL